MLNPLSLTSFEKMMVCGDRPGYSLTFTLVFEFVGFLRRETIEKAVNLAARRHPLLQATVVEDAGSLSWSWDQAKEIPICWGGEGWSTPLNPYKQGGVRIAARLAERSSLQFEFHHGSCDGDGALLFIVDVLKAYDEGCGGKPRFWGRVEADALVERGRLPKPNTGKAGKAQPWWTPAKLALDFLTCIPEQIRGDRKTETKIRPFSTHVFDSEQTRAFLKTLKERDCGFNDIAMALLFQTLARWQSERSGSSGFRKIRILMPTSLRELSDRRMGAANRISFAFPTRRRDACLRNFQTLLQSIREENDYIKTARPDLLTLVGLELVDRLGLLKFLPLLPNLQSTAVFTSMGDLTQLRGEFKLVDERFQVGDVLLDTAAGTSPVGQSTRLAIAAVRVADRMIVSLRSDPATFSTKAEQELLTLYVQSWLEWGSNESSRRPAPAPGPEIPGETQSYSSLPELDATASRVLQIVASRVELLPEDISFDRPFEELGFESLDSLDIMFALEDEFDIVIPDEVARSVRNLRDLVQAVVNALDQAN